MACWVCFFTSFQAVPVLEFKATGLPVFDCCPYLTSVCLPFQELPSNYVRSYIRMATITCSIEMPGTWYLYKYVHNITGRILLDGWVYEACAGWMKKNVFLS